MRFLAIRDLSELTLIMSNAVTLIGVFFWGWSVFDTMILYWIENVIIGAVNILKIITLPVDFKKSAEEIAFKIRLSIHSVFLIGRMFLAAFFSFHYGMFMMVHGMLLFALFGKMDVLHAHLFSPFNAIGSLMYEAWRIEGMAWPIIGLVLSHAFSYIVHFWIKGERRSLSTSTVMSAPYSRMVVLHVVLIFGGWIILVTGQSVWALVLLVLVKIVVDLQLHRKAYHGKGAA